MPKKKSLLALLVLLMVLLVLPVAYPIDLLTNLTVFYDFEQLPDTDGELTDQHTNNIDAFPQGGRFQVEQHG